MEPAGGAIDAQMIDVAPALPSLQPQSAVLADASAAAAAPAGQGMPNNVTTRYYSQVSYHAMP
jgi:hypothetical protein